ncbi:MAG: hypothetical protein AAF429_02855 [Pseudomonadota bacterium]
MFFVLRSLGTAFIAAPYLFFLKLVFEFIASIVVGVILFLFLMAAAAIPGLFAISLFPVAFAQTLLTLPVLHSMLAYYGGPHEYSLAHLRAEATKVSLIRVLGYYFILFLTVGAVIGIHGMEDAITYRNVFLSLQDPTRIASLGDQQVFETVTQTGYFVILALFIIFEAILAVPMAAGASALVPGARSYEPAWGLGYRAISIFITWVIGYLIWLIGIVIIFAYFLNFDVLAASGLTSPDNSAPRLPTISGGVLESMGFESPRSFAIFCVVTYFWGFVLRSLLASTSVLAFIERRDKERRFQARAEQQFYAKHDSVLPEDEGVRGLRKQRMDKH